MTTMKQTMKPTAEIYEIAKRKAAKLEENTQIRVGGSDYLESYWVFNFQGTLFIGSVSSESLPKFFKNRPEYVLADQFGIQRALVQQLI